MQSTYRSVYSRLKFSRAYITTVMLHHSIIFRVRQGALFLVQRTLVGDIFAFPSVNTNLLLYIAVGLNFGVLFVWVLISAITLPIFQWLARRSEETQMKANLRGAR